MLLRSTLTNNEIIRNASNNDQVMIHMTNDDVGWTVI